MGEIGIKVDDLRGFLKGKLSTVIPYAKSTDKFHFRYFEAPRQQ